MNPAFVWNLEIRIEEIINLQLPRMKVTEISQGNIPHFSSKDYNLQMTPALPILPTTMQVNKLCFFFFFYKLTA